MQGVALHAEGCRVDSRQRLHRFLMCTNLSGGAAYEGGGATSELYLPSPTPFYVAVCGRLQLGVDHWTISVALLQVVDN